MKLRVALAAALLALGLQGCKSAPPPVVGESGPRLPDAAAEDAYRKALAADSDREEIYAVLDTRVFAAATYQSMAFREARVRRLGAFQVHPAALVEKNLADERAEHEKFHEVFLGVHVNEGRYNEFDKKNSIWRLALVTPAGEATPVEVERIGRADLNIRAMYPYVGSFWVAYRVRFAREGVLATPGPAVFRIASTLGKADFEFNLD